MSILDFAENPHYQIVAVALASDDCAVIMGVKKAQARAALTLAISMLQGELDRLGPVS